MYTAFTRIPTGLPIALGRLRLDLWVWEDFVSHQLMY